MNEPIVQKGWEIVLGDPLLDGMPHGYCLKAVRVLVEKSLGWEPFQFYEKYGVTRTSGAPPGRQDWSWWASDIEASMKQLGLAVPYDERQPGDLVFNYRAAKPYGHVGLLLERPLVLELVSPEYRPTSMSRSNVCLTRLAGWQPTLIARLAVPADSPLN